MSYTFYAEKSRPTVAQAESKSARQMATALDRNTVRGNVFSLVRANPADIYALHFSLIGIEHAELTHLLEHSASIASSLSARSGILAVYSLNEIGNLLHTGVEPVIAVVFQALELTPKPGSPYPSSRVPILLVKKSLPSLLVIRKRHFHLPTILLRIIMAIESYFPPK